MNDKQLNAIFRNYIEKFDQITYEPHLENYKWEIAYDFRSQMDIVLSSSNEEMPSRMKVVVDLADNLLSNQYELPGGAICEYAKREPDKMRSMLQNLFSEDGGDLIARQKRIDAFVDECASLQQHYFPDSFKFKVGQRAVMVLLGLYDPENNYLYKPTQATEFADCVEFYDDFGPSTHFNLQVYYRMCDELVAAMRGNQELMDKHMSRYINPVKPLHKDTALHILAFDIIYAGTTYHLYNDIPYEHISTAERKQYFANREKAEKLAEAMRSANDDFELYQEAIHFYSSILPVNAAVKHKLWGAGTVIEHNDAPSGYFIKVSFPAYPEGKGFEIGKALVEGFLMTDYIGIEEKNEKYKKVILLGKSRVISNMKKAEDALKPYEEYLS